MLDTVQTQVGAQAGSDVATGHGALDFQTPADRRPKAYRAPAGGAVMVTVVASLGFWIALIGWWILP